jgi:hypothetical protein
MTVTAAPSESWYRALNATKWKTLVAAISVGCSTEFETYALVLTVGVALRQLLDPSLYPQIPA